VACLHHFLHQRLGKLVKSGEQLLDLKGGGKSTGNAVSVVTKKMNFQQAAETMSLCKKKSGKGMTERTPEITSIRQKRKGAVVWVGVLGKKAAVGRKTSP